MKPFVVAVEAVQVEIGCAGETVHETRSGEHELRLLPRVGVLLLHIGAAAAHGCSGGGSAARAIVEQAPAASPHIGVRHRHRDGVTGCAIQIAIVHLEEHERIARAAIGATRDPALSSRWYGGLISRCIANRPAGHRRAPAQAAGDAGVISLSHGAAAGHVVILFHEVVKITQLRIPGRFVDQTAAVVQRHAVFAQRDPRAGRILARRANVRFEAIEERDVFDLIIQPVVVGICLIQQGVVHAEKIYMLVEAVEDPPVEGLLVAQHVIVSLERDGHLAVPVDDVVMLAAVRAARLVAHDREIGIRVEAVVRQSNAFGRQIVCQVTAFSLAESV